MIWYEQSENPPSRTPIVLDSGSLTLSWAREDPLTLTQEDITNIALIYGPVELPEFISLLDRNEYNHSAGHR